MEFLRVILEALGFAICLGGMVLLYARICVLCRDIKRIREELAENRDANKGEYERLNKCKHEHVVEDFDIDINTKYVDSSRLVKRETPQMVSTSDDFMYGDDKFRCSSCGTDVDRGMNYCRNCGARLKFPSR